MAYRLLLWSSRMNNKELKRVRYVIDISKIANMVSILDKELERYNIEWIPKELQNSFMDFRNNLWDYKSSLYGWLDDNTKDDIYKE